MKNKAKIAVLVSGGGTNLQALIDAQQSGIINSGELALVVSNNSSAYESAKRRNKNCCCDKKRVQKSSGF